MRITKTAFNGGRVSPTMQWRPDLQLNATSCKDLLNWIPQVDGSVTRRYGSEVLADVGRDPGTVEYARHIDFQYGENDFDTVVFNLDPPNPPTPGVPTPVQIAVYNAEGLKVATLETPYVENEANTIKTVQSFDALYLFHPNVPTQKLIRTSETVWTLEEHQYKGGPWKLGNTDRTQIVSGSVPLWDIATSYDTGDVVIGGVTESLAGSVQNIYYNTTVEYQRLFDIITDQYYSRVSTALTPTSKVGELVTVRNAVGNIDGEWRVARVDYVANWIDLETGTVNVKQGASDEWFNDFSGDDVSSAVIDINGDRQTYYTSKIDANVGNDPAISPDEWQAATYLTGNILLNSVNDLWTEDDEGRSFRIASNEAPRIAGNFAFTDEGASSDALPVIGQVTLTTEGGIWAGEVTLQLSLDEGVTWEDIASIESLVDGERNGTVTRTITDFGALVRVFMRNRETATGETGCKYYVTVDDPQYNYFQITEYISATQVRAAPVNPMYSIPNTWRWNESAFGAENGYPSCGVVLDNTMIISGVPGDPSIVYFSTQGDWTNWVTGGFTGAAFDVSLGRDTRNVVQWMLGREILIVGTDAGEWTIAPRDKDLSLSLSNYQVLRQAEYGSSSVPALAAGDVVVYVERGSFRIRALENSIYDRGNFEPFDITVNTPDLFDNRTVRQMAYARAPVPTLWVLMDDSEILSWTFDTVNKVSGWARHAIAGTENVYSISTTPTAEGEDSLLVLADGGNNLLLLKCSIDNEVLDVVQVYTDVDDSTFYPYPARVETPLIYDTALIQNNTAAYSSAPRMLRLVSPNTFGKIFFDSVEGVAGVDYSVLAGSNAWFVHVINTSSITSVEDAGGSVLAGGVDYETFGSGNYVLELTDNAPSQDWADYTINDLGGPLTTDEYLVQADNTVLVVGVTLQFFSVEETLSTDILTEGYQYLLHDAGQGFAMTGVTRTEVVTVGHNLDNLVHPLDVMSDFKLGGPGGTVRYKAVDLLVYNSLGLEVRQYLEGIVEADQENWTTIVDTTQTQPGGVKADLYSGVQRLDFSSDTQYSGVDIQFRANGPRKSTIASMAVNLQRIE